MYFDSNFINRQNVLKGLSNLIFVSFKSDCSGDLKQIDKFGDF